MDKNVYVSFLVLLLVLISACSDDSDRPRETNPYAAEELWLCKPGIASNRCLEVDQTTTYIYSNTSQAVFEHTPAVDPEFDCFYVYPTVDLRKEPGNTEDLTNDEPMLVPLYNQAARFTEMCSVYAPLYHQMTIGTYDNGDYSETKYFDIAFNDIAKAFKQYLRESGARPFVLIGHSQGAQILYELLLQQFGDEKLRKRLISALLIGPLELLMDSEGIVFPGEGEDIPYCTHSTETSCIIAYDTIAASGMGGRTVEEPRPCVDPTRLGGRDGIFDNTIWATDNGMPFPEDVDTPWIAYPALHTAVCEADGFLSIDTIEEARQPPLSPQVLQLVLPDNLLGDTLHDTDVNWAIGDLLRIVATQSQNMP